MKIQDLINTIEAMNIHRFVGVPDSTLKPLCDYLNANLDSHHHNVTVNEGAAVALAAGYYIGSEEVSCVYMQNSGMGNALNPIVSLIHEQVYDIPMLFLIGYRGEPNTKDEPQHAFQGKITLPLLKVLDIEHAILDADTSVEELADIMKRAAVRLRRKKQFAVVVKKGALSSQGKFSFDNGFAFVREDAIRTILTTIQREDLVVTTTGKISREAYEQSDALFGNHRQLFLTVGSMGHASMIALGIAKTQPEKRVYCIDGDGAALMHMGSMAFLANQTCANMTHIVLNNQAHESVGGMPTDCGNTKFCDVAAVLGYTHTFCVQSAEELKAALVQAQNGQGMTFIEVQVSLASRADLGRPKERAVENKEAFMQFIKGE